MRVVAGKWGGRTIRAPRGASVRPTTDRVREAVFAILGGDVEGSVVLDLFAGTGAMAIESISRGAAAAVLVESSPAALRALRANLVALDANALAVTDCLNFGNPEKPEIMWQFQQAVEGISLACEKLNTPVISGNVSFYNETKGLGIYPTPVIGMVGILDDVSRATTQWFKDEGDLVILLGETKEEMGGTEYLKVVHSQERGLPPDLDLDVEAALQKAAMEMISTGLVKSAHDCSEGGLAVALSECCFRGSDDAVGCEVEITESFRADAALFGETQSRIIISAAKDNTEKLAEIAGRHGVPFRVMGRVGGGSLVIRRDGQSLIDAPASSLKKAWQEAIPKMLSE